MIAKLFSVSKHSVYLTALILMNVVATVKDVVLLVASKGCSVLSQEANPTILLTNTHMNILGFFIELPRRGRKGFLEPSCHCPDD